MASDSFTIYTPWSFIRSEEFTTDILLEEVQEIYSTGPAVGDNPTSADNNNSEDSAEGSIIDVQCFSYTRDINEEDEDDIQEEKFILRFLATNTNEQDRYLWVTDDGEVRTDGGHTNIATFFEVIHWCSPHQNNYQLICWGGQCKGHILYMDGTSLKTRKYHESTDDHDITTKFQMSPRGSDVSVRAFISKTGVPIYFDSNGNYRPEGPTRASNSNTDSDSELHPLYFIMSNVKLMKVTSV
ncbi:uncharacterized protein LOC127858085 [Dreissena polymorpha]|uniref:uncharacterized protein LOC127858085 n=1 Tax=Dreissena polymorpha TaxID=45954 RepID=UPI0022654354|nr:uncharacterized protein LOC127858085 [Dreissena polymorpha]XP_052250934.1 uncharacterized protein LOC127858085 [Dreissena polymorpha]XP_052250935.1 uncharacterized protein LOC127858085 [Dreissena polymorpha]XP_052250936.1 uncharacterized protein LOC127858085 [Dreissena polymorpha]XP_052250937.1 uncharacterized protein LOC127858085 [Dreissena polymorpha]